MRTHQAAPVRLHTRVFQDFGILPWRVMLVCWSWRLQLFAGAIWQ